MSDRTRLDELRRRVQMDPASIAFAQLAEEYRRAGQFQNAVETCRAGLTVHPTYISARVTLGRALAQLGSLDEAQRELQQVLQQAPQNLAALRAHAEVLHARGDLHAALAQYRAALVLASNDPELQVAVVDVSQALSHERLAHEHTKNLRLVAALERWLSAVHVTRAQPSA